VAGDEPHKVLQSFIVAAVHVLLSGTVIAPPWGSNVKPREATDEKS
jgi:hypothetical protein